MKPRFLPFLIGLLLLILGVIGILEATQVFQIRINIPWWAILSLLLAVWILSKAFQKKPRQTSLI